MFGQFQVVAHRWLVSKLTSSQLFRDFAQKTHTFSTILKNNDTNHNHDSLHQTQHVTIYI